MRQRTGVDEVAPRYGALARPLAQAGASLGRFLWHEQGRALADFFGTSKGSSLTSTIRRCVFSIRGNMGIVARKTLEHALGTMPRQDPRTYGPSHPKSVGLDRALANTQGAWAHPCTSEQSLSLRETWTKSLEAWMNQIKVVPGG
ncbi:hypothetical protein Syun_009470 [Stephania yunnanensis]|uniref:Uncharacterized protein n=1 Tax=Stephania yunnanensis TaxID=152371 RepID=A0AAP0KEH8_9MAGN